MRTVITLIVATLISLTAHAQCVVQQSVCPANDPNRFAAVLTGANGSGYAELLVDEDNGMLHYRLDVAPAQLLRDGATVLRFNQQQGSMAVAARLLDEIAADPSAFTVSSGALSGRLNGRGTILMAGELSWQSGGSSRNGGPRAEVAANATGVFSLGFVDDDPSSDYVRVDYDVMTDSIEDFDGATLVLVGADGFARDILDIGSADGFVDGRVHGSVLLSRAELQQLVDNPSGYSLQFRSPADGNFKGGLVEAVTMFLPAFGRAQNGAGNQFASDLRLYNPSDEPVNVFIQFYPAGATSALAGNSALIRLAPGQSRTIPDAVHTLFGKQSAMGSLRIVTGADVIVDSEIGGRFGGNQPGFGQFISGLSGCSAVTQGALTGLSADQSLRTNLIVGNPGVRAVFARFELRDPQNRLLDSATLSLGGSEQMMLPLAALFPNAGSIVRNAVMTVQADAPLFVGSSLVQNDGTARFNVARDTSKPF